jgi:hypothetical protein
MVVALGLASRMYASSLPAVLSLYAGDTLWAVALFLSLGLLWPSASTRRLGLGAAVLSLLVELSQLAHPGWLETVRRWPGVGLLIGYDFVWTDLACYAIGVVLGVGLDRSWRTRQGVSLPPAYGANGHPAREVP